MPDANSIDPSSVQNPLDNSGNLRPNEEGAEHKLHPQTEIMNGDSATTQAEKIERHGSSPSRSGSPNKRQKIEHQELSSKEENAMQAADLPPQDNRVKGVAPIKAEYLITAPTGRQQAPVSHMDDDAAESSGKQREDDRDSKKKNQGGSQNKGRTYGKWGDSRRLCRSRATHNEFSPAECRFGDKCKEEHDLRKYLKEGRSEDLTTLGGNCPVLQAKGLCTEGWKCRWVKSHSAEVTREDGRSELTLNNCDDLNKANGETGFYEDPDVVNNVQQDVKMRLRKKQVTLEKTDKYMKWFDERQQNINKSYGNKDGADDQDLAKSQSQLQQEMRAGYREPPFLPSEKRRIYYGPETPILAPLTTQGNLPFRRLCVSLGAQVTWSEMAMGMPLLQGEKSEWALVKAHKDELTPPRYNPSSILTGYDHSKDIKFGVQIAANKPWLAMKTTEVLTAYCPSVRAIDLNCGCPIDLVFRQGAGSALLDSPGKLEKILRGMNAVSNEVPITVKIRMGTKDNDPTADKLVQRFVIGGGEARDLGEGPAGVAAITLHGRSRQQRYTRSANWSYISDCAGVISRLHTEQDDITDTVREADARQQTASNNGKVYFIGNGDCYSHEDYDSALTNSKVDAVMIARGALIKPWVFEEIEQRQYLDKTATERLAYIEQFVRNGLEYWGSDEVGVGTTRRFLLEWLSFTCRYIPVGLLEVLPPRLGDRPPAFKGRNEMETLLSSPNYLDWIKIRYVGGKVFTTCTN